MMTTTSTISKTAKGIIYSFLGVALVTAGCSGTSKIAQSSEGTVYLEEVNSWMHDANHPAVIDQVTLQKIVRGLYSNDGVDSSTGMSAGGSKPMRVFSDEDAEFLAPLLAQGLSKAKPEQIVRFRVSSPAGSGSEPTAGSIYVRNGFIHLTITKGPRSTIFTPQAASRTEPAPAYLTAGIPGMESQVIDYHELAMAPMPPSMTGSQPVAESSAPAETGQETTLNASASAAATADSTVASGMSEPASMTDDQLMKVKETIAKKENEIDMLRKESDWMKQQLKARDEEIKALKTVIKTKTKKKRATAEVTR
ncbi:hypothetical protein [Petrachloros mirabilis]